MEVAREGIKRNVKWKVRGLNRSRGGRRYQHRWEQVGGHPETSDFSSHLYDTKATSTYIHLPYFKRLPSSTPSQQRPLQAQLDLIARQAG